MATVTAGSDAEIDAVLARLDGPPRPDGLDWPAADGRTRLVVATASDGQLRAVVRRLVRRYAPPPSRRPADLAGNRTVPDLPPIGLLPLDPARAGATDRSGSARPIWPVNWACPGIRRRWRRRYSVVRSAASICCATTAVRSRWTARCSAAADEAGQPLAWRGRVEVDDIVLSAGDEPLLACALGNAGGYAELEGVRLLTDPDPADGAIEVAVAVPVVARSRFGQNRVRLEVRRARGRAVAVTPRDDKLPFLDDGVAGELGRKRSWWVEPGAWAVYHH